MIYHLILTLEQRPEVLERVLRVTRHRGFRVCEMHMSEQDDKHLLLDMTVASERAIELLSRQLVKLMDVTACEVQSSQPLASTING
ncbi:acetolactate synthase 2 small subunit [Shewanella yunxiaonensis]|uniref:Acetolactate synthase 2 small subunit n=1 Tax=Shewanella yunxiaonensis TaxID=2829809 RepID=A0ABX7YV59_9GAMM|nr:MULTISPECIES: acetolactate synthase 2 small subunit [Shewanella]MDF0535171.1 acetolactate synthase 2 small subunit [Shewanella sp. A32]QUN06184.1 acetolactate synthase 2 small subunit [Shewanella yunxiaonensis]